VVVVASGKRHTFVGATSLSNSMLALCLPAKRWPSSTGNQLGREIEKYNCSLFGRVNRAIVDWMRNCGG
jgi:hypothetical protein